MKKWRGHRETYYHRYSIQFVGAGMAGKRSGTGTLSTIFATGDEV